MSLGGGNQGIAMDSAPVASVALSTYNGALYLREQIDSILAQEGVDLELVCVDDGSTDGTRAILEEYAGRDPRVRWSPNPGNLGPTSSFERALSMCAGRFLVPCDQDDYCEPHKLRTLLDAIGDADLVYCDSAYIDATGRPLGARVSDSTQMLEGRDPLPFLFGNSVSGHASLLRRELFEAAHPFPDGTYHDWWLALCAAGRGGVIYVDKPLVRFRRHCDAFSPMGREHHGREKCQLTRTWLEQRRVLLRAYASRGLREAPQAMRLSRAMETAMSGGPLRPLLVALWDARNAAPRWTGIVALDGAKLAFRFAKKIRRTLRRLPAAEDLAGQK